MREADWPPARTASGPILAREDLQVAALGGLGLVLLSGAVEAALARHAPGAPVVGLAGEVGDGAHALAFARDRVLLVAPAPLPVEEGWQAEGFAATVLDGAWAVFEIAGARAREVIAGGTAADLAAGSPSAAVGFAGLRALLARRGDTFRLLVEAPMADYAIRWLDGA